MAWYFHLKASMFCVVYSKKAFLISSLFSYSVAIDHTCYRKVQKLLIEELQPEK
jgi:hypothetical protein